MAGCPHAAPQGGRWMHTWVADDEPTAEGQGHDVRRANRKSAVTLRAWLCFFGLFAAGCGGFSRAGLYEGPPLAEPEYRLGVADVIAVDVKDNPTFSTQQAVVRPDGLVTLPMVDDVRVVGLTPAQVRAEIVRKLEAFIKQPMVTVSLVQLNSYEFYVLGRVQGPNRYTAHGQVTVLQALAMAGDVTPYATPADIVVIRRFPDGLRRIRFDYPAVVDGTRLQDNIHLATGDVVYVP